MDNDLETEGRDVRGSRKPKLETLVDDSSAFCTFLVENGRKVQETTVDTPHVTASYLDEFSAVFFPPNANTPLHEFTGTEPRVTVLLSEARNAADTVSESTSSPPSTSPHPVQWESPVGDSEGSEMDQPLCATWQKSVKFGQQLSNKRVFLNQTVPLHSGHMTQPTVSTDLICSHATLHTGVSLDKARYLCSLYALGARNLSNPLPTMWVITSTNTRKVVAMGTTYRDSTLHTYTISEEDSLQSSGQSLESNRQINYGPGSVDSCAFSEYEISCTASELASSGCGQLVLQFAWTNPESPLAPPPESADAVLKITANPGAIFSPVFAVFQELKTLHALCKVALGQNQWPSTDGEESLEVPISLSSKVEVFLEEAMSPQFQPLEMTVISPTADHHVYEPRTDLDFVERLWMFAKEAQSFEDLREVFAAVFKALLLNKVQPFLHRNSSSVLSSTFRQALLCAHKGERQALAAQFQSLLSDSKLTTSLVEAGMEKLERDYKSFFVSADLLTGSQLDEFFDGNSSLLYRCQLLFKIHNVLELTAAAMSFLNMPTATLSALAKVALQVHRTSSCDDLSSPTPVFHLPLPAHSHPLKSVVALCSNLSPSLWVQAFPRGQVGREGSTLLTVLRNRPLFENERNEDTSGRLYQYRGHCVSVTV